MQMSEVNQNKFNQNNPASAAAICDQISNQRGLVLNICVKTIATLSLDFKLEKHWKYIHNFQFFCTLFTALARMHCHVIS